MFTPQEIQEKTFEKAVFGGYDMQTVDEFLEPLTADYITLYRENAVLKSKMKVLVEKLEEYRAQEQSMRKAIVTAQRTADAMVADAERKCARIVSEAGAGANVDSAVAMETERLENAKKTALNFIQVVEQDIKAHLELLEKLKSEELLTAAPEETPAVREPVRKPYDFDREEAAAEPAAETAVEIAETIEQNIARIMDAETPTDPEPQETPAVPENTIKFTNLQFGRNYDPTI